MSPRLPLAISSLSGGIIGGSRIQVRLAHPDASTAYNSQRTSKSSSSTPGGRSLQAVHHPPPSPIEAATTITATATAAAAARSLRCNRYRHLSSRIRQR
ncbi:hypothetical protein TcBrA4_0109400 [Trypanosoma cruzi]|nr:hypothetical protein TcBrA4_0109400 [Trypanosoma cruzi]